MHIQTIHLRAQLIWHNQITRLASLKVFDYNHSFDIGDLLGWNNSLFGMGAPPPPHSRKLQHRVLLRTIWR